MHTPDHTIVKGKFVFKEGNHNDGGATINDQIEYRCKNIIKTLLYSGLRNYRIEKT